MCCRCTYTSSSYQYTRNHSLNTYIHHLLIWHNRRRITCCQMEELHCGRRREFQSSNTKWEQVWYTQKCISPLKTSRKNHRQDQAILSVLMHSAKVEKSCIGGHDTDVLIHNDCKGVTCGLLREFVVTSINQKYRVSIPLSPDC